MSRLSKFIRAQQVRRFRRRINRHHQLRRELAEYVLREGFEIGDYSVGWPSVRRFPGAKLKVGKFCSIAEGATFVLGGEHATRTATTYWLEPHFDGDSPDHVMTTRGDIVVGSDVWIASNALIRSGITIGDGAVVGLGSVVVEDVPPYATVFGNPARVISRRFPDAIIAELLALRWWDLEPQQIASLRPLMEETDITAFLAALRQCRGLPAKPERMPCTTPKPAAEAPEPRSGDLEAQVAAIIAREHPSFSAGDMHTPFERLGIDSFAMLMIRTRVEEALNKALDNRQWEAVVTPADIARALGAAARTSGQAAPGAGATARRRYALNMPQMALGGLSESWLFKELGDIHWSMLARGLGAPSHMLRDSNGDRIYATFTRFRFASTCPLSDYRENEELEIAATMSRYGAGMYFSKAAAKSELRAIDAALMSSFSKIGASGSNTALLKGVPEIPPECDIPAVETFLEFGGEYRAHRAHVFPQTMFECEYEITPSHDINGVGLLYFAAYPIINDICAARHAGRSFATAFSTTHRDVYYFGNSDCEDTLIFRLHEWTAHDAGVAMQASISRKSDGAVIAHILTRKARLDRTIQVRDTSTVVGASA